MATRSEVVAEARTWLKTRWQHQARVKGVGVDCLNLVVAVALKLQLTDQPNLRWEDFPEYQGYGRYPDGTLLLQGCDRFLNRIPMEQIQPADILVFQFTGTPQHFGIITQNPPLYMVHAYATARGVVEHGVDASWLAKVVQAFRFRNLED